jgi:cyclopropane fatty-acyl-phospholipid synthase-like methyltransferase
VDSASRYAARCDVAGEKHVIFSLLDYTNTGLPAGSYDGVIAIESVCYALETHDFLKEAFRLLKPGGRLVILDGFRTRKALSVDDELLMKSWLSGWGASDLDTVDELCEKATQCGFDDVKFENLQKHFRPSHYASYRFTRFLCPVAWLFNRLGRLSNTMYGHLRASRDVWYAAERDLCVQGIISAVKPSN